MIKITLLTAVLLVSNAYAQAADLMAADVAAQRAKAGELILIDVRRPDEWKRSGVAVSAHKISMHKDGFLQHLSNLTSNKKDAPIALICATGVRTTWLANELEKLGYTNVINVSEGMMGSQFGPGWLKRGLPTKPFS